MEKLAAHCIGTSLHSSDNLLLLHVSQQGMKHCINASMLLHRGKNTRFDFISSHRYQLNKRGYQQEEHLYRLSVRCELYLLEHLSRHHSGQDLRPPHRSRCSGLSCLISGTQNQLRR